MNKEKEMDEVTRQDLIDWFGSDNELSDERIQELNEELENARERVFFGFGF